MITDLDRLKAEYARRELAKRSFCEYLAYVGGKQWKRTKMSTYLADEVQRFIETDTGNAYDILVIECPPQHGKSTTVTEALPSWVLGRYPEWRVILGSYNEETAERFTRRNREKVTNYGDKIFGVHIGKINRATEFELDGHLGRLISRGIMGGVTGNPANLMLIDDAIKNRQDADSDSTRGKLWDEWLNSFKTRLAAKAKVVVIGTPWREDDYLASILRTEPTARLIRLPVEAEENDPLGRGIGEALCPEIGKDNAWLAQFKAGYINDPEGGLRAWTALYQCSPRVEGGNILHRDWWRYYDPSDEQNQYFPTEVISVDAAFKDSESNDFVAISVVGKRGTDVYVEYMMNKHLDFTETCNAIRQIKRLYPRASRVLIEDKANGSAIINVLQREMFCIPVNPRGGKVSRVNAVSAAVESGHVFLPKDASWVGEFLDQATAFPAAAHDDMCFAAGTKIATIRGDIPIENVKTGDYVITPFGLRRVINSGMTGMSEVVTRCGITGTKTHPIFNEKTGYNKLDDLTSRVNCSILSMKEVISWKYRKLLYSMESNTDSWAQESIISVSQSQTKVDDTLKDFMSRFGSFILERQFQKAMRFITRTATLLITTLITWSVYRGANTGRKIASLIKCYSISTKSDLSQRSGTGVKRDESGIKTMPRRALENDHTLKTNASTAVKNLLAAVRTELSSVATIVKSIGNTITKRKSLMGYAVGAGKNSQSRSRTERRPPKRAVAVAKQNLGRKAQGREQITERLLQKFVRNAVKSIRLFVGMPAQTEVCAAVRAARLNTENEEKSEKIPVYNLTVDKCHLYYADGILVHNCDSFTQACSYLLFMNGGLESGETEEERQTRLLEEEASVVFLNSDMYSVYDRPEDEIYAF